MLTLFSHKYSNFFEKNDCDRNDLTCSVMFEDESGFNDYIVSEDTLFTYTVSLNCQYRMVYRQLDFVQVNFKQIFESDMKKFNFKTGPQAIDVNSFEWDLCKDKIR